MRGSWYESTVTVVPDEMLAYRSVLRAQCYRMLGHPQDADDAVQDTFVRAVKGVSKLQQRDALRPWLVQIATRVCLDALADRKRRRMPTEQPPGTPSGPFTPTDAGEWVAPYPDAWLPDELTAARAKVDLAFVTLLQQLPARQRAALLLADVFELKAAEVAETLEWTVAGVNSALQRARTKLERSRPSRSAADPALVERYRDAFIRYDVDAIVQLLTDDVTFDMPPIPLWLRGREHVRTFLRGPGAECQGSVLMPLMANGCPGFAQYRHGGRTPWALVVLELDGDRVAAVHSFLDTAALFPLFGCPSSAVSSTDA